MDKKSRYAEAGVDIDKADSLIKDLKPVITDTFRRGVITDIGGFAGFYALDMEKYHKPVLVSSTDGVGTKLKIAFMTGIHHTVGKDLVAMCVNDVIVSGAQPLFFLDYFATGSIKEEVSRDVVKGIAEACKEAGCSLIGGETAEMPGFYKENEYDLAGFVVGVVERDKIIDGSEISVHNVLIGFSSSGLHSNGYSLARKVFFDELGLSVNDKIPEFPDQTIGELLLTPTKIYVDLVLNLSKQFPIHGIVNITGGGFWDNIPRILPNSAKAVIKKGSWPIQPVFSFLQKKGDITEKEMFKVFNNGIGMILMVSEAHVQDILMQCNALGEEAFVIGHVAAKGEGESDVEIIS